MVDRSPEGRLEVAGPPLRYMHRCNWKMLVENQTDTCHPMVAHESSAGMAIKLFEESEWPADKPKPMAMQIIAPFMSPYEFFEEMGSRTWPNGHGHTGVHHSIHSDYSAIPDYWEAMSKPTAGEGQRGAGREPPQYGLLPNIMIKGPIQQLRNFIPLAADKTLVESYIYRLVASTGPAPGPDCDVQPDDQCAYSIVGHDDLEMYERAQEGLQADGLEWVNLQRLHPGEEDFMEEVVVNGTSERQMRNQFTPGRSS